MNLEELKFILEEVRQKEIDIAKEYSDISVKLKTTHPRLSGLLRRISYDNDSHHLLLDDIIMGIKRGEKND